MNDKPFNTYKSIKEDIIFAKYLPGERLVVTDLKEKYDSSSLHIREALKKLNDEGLVELIPNKGARVAKMSIEEIMNSYGLLENLEVYAAKLYLPKSTKKDLRKIEKINKELAVKAKSNNYSDYLAGNLDFHIVLSSFGNNSILTDFITNLRQRNLKYSYFVLALSERLEDYIEQHKTIIKACYDKNSKLLDSTIKHHISSVKEKVMINYGKKYD